VKDRKNRKIVIVEEQAQLVTFRVGAEDYGLDIESITEVIRPLKITPLPKMPIFVEGVINLRGVIIPVVDLRKRFELAAVRDDTRKKRMIITQGAFGSGSGKSRGLLGLVVDSVEEVIFVPKRDIEAAPAAATSASADFISGVGKVRDRLIIILDIRKILSQQERAELAEVGDA
jgi:purine-binding chemotaxis protein CheW